MVMKYDPDAFHRHPNIFVRLVEKKRVKVILKMVNIYKEDRVLEVGCGAGNVLEQAPKGKLFGVDISPYLLKKAEGKLKGKAYLLQGDAQNLPFKDRSFKGAICSEVLEHLLIPSMALCEISRVLTSGGVMVVSVPNEFWINRIKKILIRLRIFHWFVNRHGGYREMPERMEDEWHLHTFRLEEWLDLLKKYFKVTRLRRIPFFWLPLRYVIRLKGGQVFDC